MKKYTLPSVTISKKNYDAFGIYQRITLVEIRPLGQNSTRPNIGRMVI